MQITSAVVKRYIPEIGTNWVLSWILPTSGDVTIISELTVAEIFSVFARRQREGTLSAAQVATLQSNFLLHVEKGYITVPLESSILIQTRSLLNAHPLRTLDGIQLASALQAIIILSEPITFITADKNLLAAALAEGFPVDNPLAHP